MIIDAHVHICPPEVRSSREDYLPHEPEFAAIYQNPEAKLVGAGELVASMDEQGVDMSVVFGFPWRQEDHFRLNNDYVLQAAQRYPDRLIPLCCLDAFHPRAESEVLRCLAAEAQGVGELALYGTDLDQTALDKLESIAAVASGAGKPVLLHTNEPVGHAYPGKAPMTLRQLYALIRLCPETRWILAHLGGGLPFFGFMKKEVREALSNCWFDTAAMPFLYRPEVLQVMAQAVGIDKLLLGTDFPLLPPSRYFKEFQASGLSGEQTQAICGHNARQLFRLH